MTCPPQPQDLLESRARKDTKAKAPKDGAAGVSRQPGLIRAVNLELHRTSLVQRGVPPNPTQIKEGGSRTVGPCLPADPQKEQCDT